MVAAWIARARVSAAWSGSPERCWTRPRVVRWRAAWPTNPSRSDSSAARVEGGGGVGEAVLGVGDGAEHRLGVHQAPAVLDGGQVPHRLGRRPGGAGGVAQHDRPEGAEQEAAPPSPRAARAAGRRRRWRPAQLQHVLRAGPAGCAGTPDAGRRRPAGGRRRAVRRSAGPRRGRPGPGRRFRPTPPASRPAAGRSPGPVGWRGPGGGERAAEAVGTGDTVAEDDPRPAEARWRCGPEQRVVGGGPGEGDVDVRPLRPDGRRQLGLARAADGGRAPVARPAYHAACAARGVVAGPTRAGGRRERADAVEEPVASGAVLGGLDVHEGAVDEAAERRRPPSCRGRRARARTCSAAARGAPPEKQDSAHRPRWSSGKSRS